MIILRTCPYCGIQKASKASDASRWTCENCHRMVSVTSKSAPVKPWLVASVALVTLALFSCCLLVPATSVSLEHNRGLACRNNLSQIGLALHNYADRYGSFPPAYIADAEGRPMHSWRVLLLPYVDQLPLYEEYRFDEPWDGPNNSRLHDQVVQAYLCPSGARRRETVTSYLAVVGEQTAWPGTEPIAMRDFPNGLSRTISVIEVRNSDIHWMEPRDLEFDTMSFAVNDSDGSSIGSDHVLRAEWFWREDRLYAHVLMADGWVARVPVETEPQAIKALLTIDGGKDVDAPWLSP